MAVMKQSRVLRTSPAGEATDVIAQQGAQITVLEKDEVALFTKVKLMPSDGGNEGWVSSSAVDEDSDEIGTLDKTVFSRTCYYRAVEYAVPIQYMIATALLRSKITDGQLQDGVGYGPFGLSETEWETFRSSTDFGYEFSAEDRRNWPAQCRVFAAMIHTARVHLKRLTAVDPTALDLALAQMFGHHAAVRLVNAPVRPVSDVLDDVSDAEFLSDGLLKEDILKRHASYIDGKTGEEALSLLTEKFDAALAEARPLAVDAGADITETLNDPGTAPPSVPSITAQPQTTNSTDFSTLRDEYINFFFGGSIRDNRGNDVEFIAKRALLNKARYEAVASPLGIPWWFVAAIHSLESNADFDTHLHNGDPLNNRTVNVPAGRPSAPPANGSAYTWEESATDALRLKQFHVETNWAVTNALYRWEKYNGFGYRSKRVPSPYLWSFSTVYEKGKFVSDGVYSADTVSRQCGAAVILMYLYQSGEVKLYDDENEQLFDPPIGHSSVDTDQAIGAPPSTSHLSKFDQFFRDHLPADLNFTPAELLVKGSKHHDPSEACFGLNVDPPEEIWPNCIELVQVLQEFRNRINARVRLDSVYRGRNYNTCIGGASGSYHMRFQAADFRVLGSGTRPRDWARILDQMRSVDGFFKGGVKAYRTFVHVDTRGWNANW